jgi:hypothetical protein
MQLRDQPRRHACRLIAWRWSIGHASEHLDDLLRRAFPGERGESGRLIPWIDTRPRERGKHGQMHSICVVGNGREQEIIQIGSQSFCHAASVLPRRARRYRHKAPCAETQSTFLQRLTPRFSCAPTIVVLRSAERSGYPGIRRAHERFQRRQPPGVARASKIGCFLTIPAPGVRHSPCLVQFNFSIPVAVEAGQVAAVVPVRLHGAVICDWWAIRTIYPLRYGAQERRSAGAQERQR